MYTDQFIDGEPPLISGHKDGTECFGCENCFVPNPKFKGYTGGNHVQEQQECAKDGSQEASISYTQGKKSKREIT